MFKQSLYPVWRALEEGAREDGVALRRSAAVVHWQWSELGHGEIQRDSRNISKVVSVVFGMDCLL